MDTTSSVDGEHDFGTIIELNVGGTHFTTSLDTLTKYPNSMLAAMFSGRHSIARDSKGHYFIDRDGKYFRYVLNFLRDSEVRIPPDNFLRICILKEAQYFSLQELENQIDKLNCSPLLFEYSHNFDKNGIIYWLGTDRGKKKQFVNPGKSGFVKVDSSGLAASGRGGNISLLRKNYDFIGRDSVLLYTQAMPSSWFSVDFTASRIKIKPTHYTLKHGYDIPDFFLRHWDFLGSKDGYNWVILCSHSNDTHLNGSGYATHTWKITNNDNMHYTHFRIRITGKDSSDSFSLVCCGFELYGELLVMDE